MTVYDACRDFRRVRGPLVRESSGGLAAHPSQPPPIALMILKPQPIVRRIKRPYTLVDIFNLMSLAFQFLRCTGQLKIKDLVNREAAAQTITTSR